MSKNKTSKTVSYVILFIVILVFVERLITLQELGPGYTGYGDSMDYYYSAIEFAETGVISYQSSYPTAQIMPGITVLFGIFIKLFGTDIVSFSFHVRLFYYFLASVSALITFKTVSLFVSPWYGVISSMFFLLPNMAWMSNSLGTETPYILFFLLVLYYTFKLGEDISIRNIIIYSLSFLMALLFRANIMLMLIGTPVYLLFVKKLKLRDLTAWACILGITILCFIVPWTIRNYKLFNDFIPITYGEGNPLLLGTLWADGSLPENNAEIDELTDSIFYEKYKEYYDDDGNMINPLHESYLRMKHDTVEAKVRMMEWINRDPVSFLKNYLLRKPRLLLNWVWYWDSVFGCPYDILHYISIFNMLVCGLGLGLSFFIKQHCRLMLYFSALYILFIYTCSSAFVSDRYSSLFMPVRYIMFGISISLIIDTITLFLRRQTTINEKN